jgi:hypothetical protein
MRAHLAAGYVGEKTVEDFLKRVGRDYPKPRVADGRRRLGEGAADGIGPAEFTN